MTEPEGCVELVLEHADPKEVANMINYRYKNGWKLDRIINTLPEYSNPPRLHVYVFNKL